MGNFILHRFNGDEIYKINSANISFNPEDNLLCFNVDTEEKPVKTLPDTIELSAHPNAEIFFKFASFTLNDIHNSQFLLPLSYNEELEEYFATLYYCEHQDLDNNILKIQYKDQNKYYVHWTGTTTDINYYDGSKPDTTVEIEGEFVFEDIEKFR